MSTVNYLGEQCKINDSRQVFTPYELLERWLHGSVRVGVFAVHTVRKEDTRLTDSLAVLQRFLATKKGLVPAVAKIIRLGLADVTHTTVIVPEWCGVLDRVCHEGVDVTLERRTAWAGNENEPPVTFEDLPPVTEGYLGTSYFPMGLAPAYSYEHGEVWASKATVILN